MHKHVASVFVSFEVSRRILPPSDRLTVDRPRSHSPIAVCINGVLRSADCGKTLPHSPQCLARRVSDINYLFCAMPQFRHSTVCHFAGIGMAAAGGAHLRVACIACCQQHKGTTRPRQVVNWHALIHLH